MPLHDTMLTTLRIVVFDASERVSKPKRTITFHKQLWALSYTERKENSCRKAPLWLKNIPNVLMQQCFDSKSEMTWFFWRIHPGFWFTRSFSSSIKMSHRMLNWILGPTYRTENKRFTSTNLPNSMHSIVDKRNLARKWSWHRRMKNYSPWWAAGNYR
jgi:hypothetical protein